MTEVIMKPELIPEKKNTVIFTFSQEEGTETEQPVDCSSRALFLLFLCPL